MIDDLTHTLASLYPDEGSIRRVAEQANISLLFINTTGGALAVWGQVVREAERRNAVDRLVAVAVSEREYPENSTLQRIAGFYQYGSSNGDMPTDDNFGDNRLSGVMTENQYRRNLEPRVSVLETKIDHYGDASRDRWEQHTREHVILEKSLEEKYQQFRRDMLVWVVISTILTGAFLAGFAFWA